MQLHDQPRPVTHLLGSINGDRYSYNCLKERIQLWFDGIHVGGWADDRNGPHWYVLENKRIDDLNPSYRVILEHFRFDRVLHGDRRHYWRVRRAESMWNFRRAIEEITGVPLRAG